MLVVKIIAVISNLVLLDTFPSLPPMLDIWTYYQCTLTPSPAVIASCCQFLSTSFFSFFSSYFPILIFVHPASFLVPPLKGSALFSSPCTASLSLSLFSPPPPTTYLLQLLVLARIHPTIISESFQKALDKSTEVLTDMGQPVELSDRETLLNSATTSLNSKVVSQYSSLLSPMSVDAVMKVIDPTTASGVDLRDIKIVKKLGGTIDDCELVEGLVLTQKLANTGVTRVEKAKIGLIQFCLSAPKTDMDNQIVVSDYAQMDRVLREERAYILNLVKQIKKAGCNVLLIQKSILRDALSDLALHFLNKMKIMVIKDIEREDIEFICKTIGTKPVAHIDQFIADTLGSAELAEEVNLNGSGKLLKITGCASPGKTVTIVVRGSNKLVMEEAERSIHDALCVIRCLVKKRALIAGGGAPEIELALRLNEYARTLSGMDSYCVRAYGDAMEVIPSTLAENAGLNPISTVTELRNRHAQGEKTAGINIRKGGISNILEELVVQPLLVSLSALTLATETVRSILKIDDVVNTR
uniref:T-complex protein 1 subunit delta n=1 Tax=Chelydra serpentina TaxID=8475 RepID=A0A8C3XT53_CHESE